MLVVTNRLKISLPKCGDCAYTVWRISRTRISLDGIARHQRDVPHKPSGNFMNPERGFRGMLMR